MCGRYALGLTHEEILERFGFDELDERRLPVLPLPRFNVAPSQAIPVLVETDAGRELRAMRWGFKPAWMKDGGKRPPPINARSETLTERPMFRGAIARSRCLIPATGFYEWQAVVGAKAKRPWHFRLEAGGLFGFAGLHVVGPDGEETAAIITTSSNELVAEVHDRMPVILAPNAEADWLNPSETDPSAVLGLLAPYPAELMDGYPVRPLVGHDGPELIARLNSA